MKFFSGLTAASLLCSSTVLAHPVTEGSTLEARQQQYVITTGAGGNTVYPRLEVRQMKDTRPNQYTLLVLAMEQWKAQPQSQASSYFGISAIHGVPRQNFNNVGRCGSCGNADGYCPHDSVLFPAWHRVYVAMFEQEFLKIVRNIANSYTGSTRDTMVNAANSMRLPYWDWAARPKPGMPTFPRIMSDFSVTVNAPSGQRTLNNPLFRYDFTDSSGMYYGPFTSWSRTYRYPNDNSNNAASNTQSCINAVENVRQSLQDQVYQLFTSCKDYAHFSNVNAGGSTGCSNSLENIHNTIHTIVGGPGSSSASGGHMTYLPTASFDPVFWLHHANVDRIFAMWQRINPNSYGASQQAPGMTWTVAQGSTQNADSPLTPFYKDSNNNFWTTNQVRDWTVFRYTYPEFSNSDGSAASINRYVNNLYGPNANAVAGSSKRDLLPDLGDVVDGLADALPGNPLAAANGSLFQYVANIQTPRYALNGSYTVYLFNGNPTSEEPSSWVFDKNLIGPMGVMARDNMMRDDLIASGSVPLTRTLRSIVGNGLLAGLTEALVVPFLTKNLQWRVMGPCGESVDPGSIPNFAVSVVTATASKPANDGELPVLSSFLELLDVTKGQSGGLNETHAASY